MARLTEMNVVALLRDPQCPLGISLNRDGMRPILVSELERMASERFPESTPLQPALDEIVAALGGARVTPVSLDNLLRRAGRRLLGRSNPPPPDIYDIPNAVSCRDLGP